MLLIAGYASAQNPTVADIARQERARKGPGKAVRVYTTEDIRTTPPVEETPKPESTEAPAADAAPAETPAAEDPVALWLAETERLRAHIRELIDQEAVSQLDINRITNEVYSPDTNESARSRSLTALDAAQRRLTEVRAQLAKSRLELQAREQQGPPKK
jgi:hypothetical protein